MDGGRSGNDADHDDDNDGDCDNDDDGDDDDNDGDGDGDDDGDADSDDDGEGQYAFLHPLQAADSAAQWELEPATINLFIIFVFAIVVGTDHNLHTFSSSLSRRSLSF